MDDLEKSNAVSSSPYLVFKLSFVNIRIDFSGNF